MQWIALLLFFAFLSTAIIRGLCSSVEVSDCGRYVILYVSRGAEPRNKLYYADLKQLPGQQITGQPRGIAALYTVQAATSVPLSSADVV